MPTAAAKLASLLAAALLLAACASAPQQNFLRVKGGEAPTLGYLMLRKLDRDLPLLERVFRDKGDPEFLFATEDADKSYLFLYYVARNEAYLLRGPRNEKGVVEMAGPQKIDPKERALFKALIDLEPDAP